MQKVFITFRRVEKWKNKEIKTTITTITKTTTEMKTETITTRIKRIKETTKKKSSYNSKGPQIEDLYYFLRRCK
jgi:hypothetical protein